MPKRRSAPILAVLATIVGIAVVLSAAGYVVYAETGGRTAAPATAGTTPSLTPSATGTPSATATPSPTATKPPTYPASGPGTYIFAKGQGPVVGTAGTLKKYRVAVEKGSPISVDEFATMVDATLADPRSWIAGKNVRLQRVESGNNFTVYLVTPGTARKLCLAGGFDIFWHGEPYTSCYTGGRVLINMNRYFKSVPNYGAPLEAYRQYAINHEVGHALGHGHELCPGKGKPAPVMQQQTFSLQGCVAYSWPYKDGKRYAGPPGRIVPTD